MQGKARAEVFVVLWLSAVALKPGSEEVVGSCVVGCDTVSCAGAGRVGGGLMCDTVSCGSPGGVGGGGGRHQGRVRHARRLGAAYQRRERGGQLLQWARKTSGACG